MTLAVDIPNIPLGLVLYVLGLLAIALPLASDERNRRKFAARDGLYDGNGKALFATVEDLNRMGANLSALQSLLVSLQDRWDGVERSVDRIEVIQKEQREAVLQRLEGAAKSIEHVANELQLLSKAQIEHSVLLEQIIKHPNRNDR